MQKQEKRRELRLKRFWRSPKTTSSEESTGCESPKRTKQASGTQRFNKLYYTSLAQSVSNASDATTGLTGSSKPACSLPLLQVWPSQDSPRGEADGQSFIFPSVVETYAGSGNLYSPNSSTNSKNKIGFFSESQRTSSNHLTSVNAGERRRSSLYCDTLHAGDSGIDSVQASPSPNALPPHPGETLISQGDGPSYSLTPATTHTQGSPNLSIGGNRIVNKSSMNTGGLNFRRKSSALLHPDHARLFALRMKHAAALERAQTSPDQTSIEDVNEFHDNGLATNLKLCSASSSTTSSLTSIAAVSLSAGIGMSNGEAVGPFSSASATNANTFTCTEAQHRVSDPWLQPQSDREHNTRHERRRSSTMTARYSLFDALDLEYVLLRAAARGSVGPYSLSESIHKLTFTQSLAFPALARGLATKRTRSTTRMSSRPLNSNESGLNTCAKVITAIILVGLSFMVFLLVYKFVRT